MIARLRLSGPGSCQPDRNRSGGSAARSRLLIIVDDGLSSKEPPERWPQRIAPEQTIVSRSQAGRFFARASLADTARATSGRRRATLVPRAVVRSLVARRGTRGWRGTRRWRLARGTVAAATIARSRFRSLALDRTRKEALVACVILAVAVAALLRIVPAYRLARESLACEIQVSTVLHESQAGARIREQEQSQASALRERADTFVSLPPRTLLGAVVALAEPDGRIRSFRLGGTSATLEMTGDATVLAGRLEGLAGLGGVTHTVTRTGAERVTLLQFTVRE